MLTQIFICSKPLIIKGLLQIKICVNHYENIAGFYCR